MDLTSPNGVCDLELSWSESSKMKVSWFDVDIVKFDDIMCKGGWSSVYGQGD